MNEASHEDRYDAWKDLGGQDSEPSVASARAMLAAGMGDARERAIVKRAEADAAREEYKLRYQSGVAERSPEQEQGLQDLRTQHLAEAALNADDPTLERARQRARDERHKRGY